MSASFSIFHTVDIALYVILYPGVVLCLGLMLGSFSTALIDRVPKGISWVYDRRLGSARSACPSCRTVLGFADLVPLFSWVFLKGRCRHCGARIGATYPLAELACVAGCLGIFAAHGLNGPSLLMMLAMPFLVALFVIDLRHRIVPPHLVVILTGIGLCYLLTAFPLPDGGLIVAGRLGFGLVCLLVASAVCLTGERWLNRVGMGWEEVKIVGAAGVWIGLEGLPLFCIATGVIWASLGFFFEYVKKYPLLPLGPALISALYVVLTLNARG
ncbi:MAG TPA: prepilin peptidase [Alphaproteobacteria bacterium]|nr:prepilin peptidase [Alphaproteobacteria bacterium]